MKPGGYESSGRPASDLRPPPSGAGVGARQGRRAFGFWEDVEDNRRLLDSMLREANKVFEAKLWPWRFPNPNPFPEFVLFPRLARLERKVKR